MRLSFILLIPALGFVAVGPAAETEFLSQSSSKLRMSVEAVAAPQKMPRRHFFVLSDSDATPSNDFIFQENALLLARALEKRGFVHASDQESADLAIHLEYTTSRLGYNVSDSGGVRLKAAEFTNVVSIRAIDLAEYRRSGIQSTLWQLKITTEFMIGEIRMVFPYVVVASMSYLEKNTDHVERFTMNVDDPKVEKLISLAFPEKRK